MKNRGNFFLFRPLLLALCCAAVAGCARSTVSKDGDRWLEQKTASAARPEIDLGSHTLPVSTSFPLAQHAFDRGLTLAYAFSHSAAEDEFRKAAELDPKLAIAWWGVALVNGPHINYPLVPPERAKKAWDALQKAKQLAPAASELERALIGALEKRYAQNQPADRAPLDRAYMAAMRKVWKQFPKNSDAGTLFAESAMDLRPWDFWTVKGKPQPGTEEIAATLNRVLELNPNHPGANHLAIHLWEASPKPRHALPSANRLRTLVPGAGHLVHMPAHIYARVGQWPDASQSNRDAIRADEAYRAAHPKPGFYALYMAHNHHFLAFSAMMQGQSEEAIRVAREMVSGVSEDFLTEYGPIADGYMAFVPEALMRFGKWNEILAEPEPRATLPLARTKWRFARAAALTALGRMEEAEAERRLFLSAADKVPADATFGNNQASLIIKIAKSVLDGEMAAQRDDLENAITHLRKAARNEDTLRYDEPPDWMQPVRHTLGAVLLRAGKVGEAEKAYREDLVRFPDNGWSLFGLARTLDLQGQTQQAATVRQRFDDVWAKSDVKIDSTCFCQQTAEAGSGSPRT